MPRKIEGKGAYIKKGPGIGPIGINHKKKKGRVNLFQPPKSGASMKSKETLEEREDSTKKTKVRSGVENLT